MDFHILDVCAAFISTFCQPFKAKSNVTFHFERIDLDLNRSIHIILFDQYSDDEYLIAILKLLKHLDV